MNLQKLTSIKSQLVFLLLSFTLVYLVITWGYYSFVFHLIQKKEAVYVQNLLFQVVENIQTTSEDMIRYARMASNDMDTQNYLTTDYPLESLESANDIFRSFFTMTQDSQGILIALLDNNGKKTLVPKPILSILNSLDEEYGVYANDSSGFTGAIHNMYDNLDYYAYYQPILDTRASAKPNNQIGICVVVSTLTRLEKCLNQVETSPHSIFIIMNQEQDIIVSNLTDDEASARLFTQAIQTENVGNSTIQKINGEEHMVLFQEVPNTGWKVVGIIPINEIDSDLDPFLQFGTLILFLLLIIFILWGSYIFRSVIQPVMQITDFVQGDAYTTLHKRLQISNKNEIGLLAQRINLMLDKISAMTRTIFQNQSNMYELDLAKKKAELSALQSQINPHFLYNTLDCIKGYGYLSDSKEIVLIVESLSQLMRYCIKGPDVVCLRDELHIIQCYLDIISIRFENRFHFSISISEEALSISLPRFILQPLVENAVYHGLEPKYGKGTLKIYSETLPDNTIFLCIEDNGVGIPEEQLKKIKEKICQYDSDKLFHLTPDNGLALLNTHQRLQQFFGLEYGLHIESAPGKGTCIRIRLRTEPPV